jgi:hypothetical protein
VSSDDILCMGGCTPKIQDHPSNIVSSDDILCMGGCTPKIQDHPSKNQ